MSAILRARPVRIVLLFGLLWLAAVATAQGRVVYDGKLVSRSFGTVSEGRLENGHPIPPSGYGFVTYSVVGSALGRQYVHGALLDLLVETFGARAKERPDRRFVVGETGWPGGGSFWPHHRHANGLSVDVLLPLRNEGGQVGDVGAWPWNRFGYGVGLDARGRRGDLHVDFDELALLLVELGARAPAFGLRVEQILLAPEYVPLVLGSPAGKKLGALAKVIQRRPAAWRLEEPLHVDFAMSGVR